MVPWVTQMQKYLKNTKIVFDSDSDRREKSTNDAGNASEEKTAWEEGFSPDDVHHQQNHDVGRDLCKHLSGRF